MEREERERRVIWRGEERRVIWRERRGRGE